jgi:cytochrome c
MAGGKATAMNPCGAKNPCNPCGGSKVDASRFVQPAGVKLTGGSQADLIVRGRTLWNDRSLGKSGLACANCHVENYGQMQASFANSYPHQVAMPLQRAGVETVNAAEMVQFCMLVPMLSDPLPWESEELAALTAFVQDIQPGYKPVVTGMNPCNPGGSKNPNPCNPRNY